MTEQISPVAIGIISDPPTIVVSYDCISDGRKRKRRKRKMPLRDFTDKSNVKRYAFNLRQRHNKYLADVIDVTLEKMLRIIQEIQKGLSVEAAVKVVNKEYSIPEDEDLNKLEPAKLAQLKAVMDETFHKNLVKPGDPDFVYDREVKFDIRIEKSEENEWDEESEKLKTQNDNLISHVDNKGSDMSVNEKQDQDVPHESIQFQRESKPNTDEGIGQFPSLSQLSQGLVEGRSKTSSFFENPVLNSSCEKEITKSDDESSSTNNIEEALVNIESGNLEEDEDFWQ